MNQSFGSDFGSYFAELLGRATREKVFAVGLTDYFTIEGYKEARRLMEKEGQLETLLQGDILSHARRMLLLPNIELRTSFLIQGKDGKDSRVNMHVIFSEDVSCEDIEENFLRELKFWYEAEPGQGTEKRSLTVPNLKELGRKLKEQHPKFREQTDIFVGMMNAVVDAHQVAEVLVGQRSRFEKKYIVGFPCDEDLSKVSWDGQGHHARKLFLQLADFLVSSNEGTRRFGLGKLHPTPEAFLSEFKSFKPCVHSSDAHDYDKMFVPDGERHTWIKADLTFEGLRQVLHEPEHRVHVGAEPSHLGMVKRHQTRYAKQLDIAGPAKPVDGERWFRSASIPLNSGLVAIIGNKGSGKSALSDIIGLAGNSHQAEHFSFLHPQRFWKDNKRRAKPFNATLTWHDGTAVAHGLSEGHDPNAYEAVKYLPQSYLELICNEFEHGVGSRFQRELRQVIFSHVDEADRLGCNSLEELITKKNEANAERLGIYKLQIQEANRAVLAIEAAMGEGRRKRLESQIAEKARELAAHDATKPPMPAAVPPEEAAEQQTASSKWREKLTGQHETLRKLESEEADLRKRESALAKRLETASSLAEILDTTSLNFKGFLKRVGDKASELGLEPGSLVRLDIDKEPVEQVKAAATAEMATVRSSLSAAVPGSMAYRIKEQAHKIEETKKLLDEPERLRQAAIQALGTWERRRAEILGDLETPGSLTYLKEALSKADLLPVQLAECKKEREELSLQAFDCISELAEEYRELFTPVEMHFMSSRIVPADVDLGFEVANYVRGFPASLLAFIDQGKKGTFRGGDEGLRVARDMVDAADFQSREGLRSFLREMQNALETDRRNGPKAKCKVEDQLVRDRTPAELYDFIYCLDYVRPRFDLRWDGKSPEQLSPGERGTLLLVFYLLIDRRDQPLVIDQPEENLDNETIYKVLVPCIKYAKERRQMVIVTHNPNLAVVCDADQVIYASIDKKAGNELSYEAGSIENPAITRHILDVLEGTMPAFEKREARYEAVS